MGLRAQAALDARAELENVDDYGWPITITNPAGTSHAFTGYTTDIAQVLDPSTGEVISSRRASATVSIAALTAAGFALPVGVSSPDEKPWRVSFVDLAGASQTFKVAQTFPDRTIGIVVMILEAWQ